MVNDYRSLSFYSSFYQLLFLVILILLLLEVSETRRRQRKRKQRNKVWTRRIRVTPRPTKPTTTTTTTTTPRSSSVKSTISQEKCRVIVNKLPKKRQPGPICLLLNETRKLWKLREVGGFVPRYVAINIEDAHKFSDLTGDHLPMPANVSSPVLGDSSQSNQLDLKNLTRQPDNDTNIRRKRMAFSMQPGTTIREQGCQEAGSLVDGSSFLRLCRECPALTTLPANVFPPFINEVICGNGDRPLNLCFREIGSCQQEVIRFNFLRSTGEFEQAENEEADVFVEVFEPFQQDIRTCCQCRAFQFIRRLG